MTDAEPARQTASLTIDQADGTANHSTKPAGGQVTGYLQQAVAHHQAGQLQDAERLYRAILQTQPNHPDANHNLGVLAVQVKQPAAGLPHFKAALEANPNQGQYWLSYIDALIQTGQTDTARQVLAQGRQLGLNGEAVEALVGRLDRLENVPPEQSEELACAIAHRETGRYKDAALVLQSWLVSNPQDAGAYALLAQVLSLDKQDEPAWAALNIALSINPALPIVRRNHARLLLKQQKLGESLQAAQTAYQSDATDPENQLVLAAALGANNQNEQAFTLIENALRSRPNYAEAFASRALLKLRGNDLAGALADAEKALSIKPHLTQLWGIVGSLHHQFKNLPGAIEALENALDYEPDNVEHLVNLGECKRQAGAVEAAIVLLEKAIAIAPDNARAWVNFGTALQQAQRIAEAKAAYAKALELEPGQAEVASNLGALAKHEGNWEEALGYFGQALGIKPNFAEAHYNLGVALQALGRLDEAEMSYRRALEYKPNWAAPYFNLHSLLLNPADMVPSIKCMEKAVEIDPADANLRFFLGMMLDYNGDQEAAADHFARVEKSANLYRARLDAWRYLKSANNKLPIITGSNIQAFKIGIASAVNDGLVMEFGVRFGLSIRQIASLVDQEVHGFDSFEGLPEQWHNEPKGSYSTKGVLPNVPDNVALYAGWFEDTLPEFLKNNIGPVRFMNIDCDIYSSTKTVLDLLAERIIPGTVIVFDEYIGNEHWREDEFKAFQEAVVKYNWDYEYICFSFSTKQVVIRIVQ